MSTSVMARFSIGCATTEVASSAAAEIHTENFILAKMKVRVS